jgi:hypothetical protein
MTLEECKICQYNRNFENGAVHCGYDKNIVVMPAVKDQRKKIEIILNCPRKDRKG